MSTIHTLEPQLTMAEVLTRFPGAQRALFRRYHIGGCASCGFRPEETLAQVCQRNENLPLEEVIEHIRASHESDLKLQISPLDLAGVLQADPTAKLVDVRTREEYDAVHVEGSIFFSQDLMQEILGKWDRNALVAIMDHQGVRSMDAAAYFAGHGFENVKSVQGGIDGWSQQVNPDLPRYELD